MYQKCQPVSDKLSRSLSSLLPERGGNSRSHYLNFRRKGAEVDLVGLNEASATLIDKLAVHDKVDALQDFSSH